VKFAHFDRFYSQNLQTMSANWFKFWGFVPPDLLPGLHPWTALGDFHPNPSAIVPQLKISGATIGGLRNIVFTKWRPQGLTHGRTDGQSENILPPPTCGEREHKKCGLAVRQSPMRPCHMYRLVSVCIGRFYIATGIVNNSCARNNGRYLSTGWNLHASQEI